MHLVGPVAPPISLAARCGSVLAVWMLSVVICPNVVSADVSEPMADSTILEARDGDSMGGDGELLSDEAGHSEEAGHSGEAGHGGEEHGEEEPSLLSFDFGSAVFNLIIFLCVFGVLSKFVWPGVLGGLQAREEKIREDLESAEKAHADAKAVLATYEAKLNEAAAQVQEMLAEARRESEANAQRIKEEARKDAAMLREQAIADIETAKKVAVSELASHTSQMAMEVARGVVGRELSSSDHADLIRQAMERVPSQN